MQITYVATINLVAIVCAIAPANMDTLDCVHEPQKAMLLGGLVLELILIPMFVLPSKAAMSFTVLKKGISVYVCTLEEYKHVFNVL